MSAAILLPFASLTGYLLFLLRFTSWPNAFLPFFTVSSLMCLLYAAAMTGLLRPGAYCITALGLAAGTAGAYYSRGRLKGYFGRLLEPGTAIFLLLSLLLWAACRGLQYSVWDEFSHWGLTIKEIFARNSLIPADSTLACKDYPPATALFQYYWTVFTGWSEETTIFAQVVITLSAAVAFLTGIPWRQWLKMTAILVLLSLLMVVFGFRLQSLYVDHLLGFFFGAILASYLMWENKSSRAILLLLPSLLILPLIKAAGFLFALIAAAIIAADHLRGGGSPRQDTGTSRRPARLGLCLLLLLAPAISAKTWNWRVTKLNLPQTLATKVAFADLKRPFSTAAAEKDKEILSKFGKAFLSRRIKQSLPPFFMALLLAGGGLLLARKANLQQEGTRIRKATLLISAGFIAYSTGILFLYLYSFGSYEALRLASFSRYMSIFFMAWTLLAAIFLLRGPAAGDFRLLPRWIKALIILAGAGLLFRGTLHTATVGKAEFRRTVSQKAAYALSLMPAGARVYLVWQNDNGYGAQVLAYELTPHPTSIRSGPWSLGKPYYPGDVWTADITPAAWRKLLKEYDYVLLGSADQIFWDSYGGIFENQAKARGEYLFEVTVKGGKTHRTDTSPLPLRLTLN